jgi:hypothetical protein
VDDRRRVLEFDPAYPLARETGLLLARRSPSPGNTRPWPGGRTSRGSSRSAEGNNTSMTIDEVRPFERQVVSVRTHDPNLGVGAVFTGRLEIMNDDTVEVVGQPKLSGLPLGDGQRFSVSIASITEMTPPLL